MGGGGLLICDHIQADSTAMPSYVAKMRARGIDALMVSDWSGNPSPTGIRACRDNGVKLVWMMRQGQEDAPDLNGSISPAQWASRALDQLVEAGGHPSELAGIAIKDEPVLYRPNDTKQASLDYGNWLRECVYELSAAWPLSADCLIWWNCNTPSGRRLDHAGRAAVSLADYGGAYSLETWMGDDGGRMQIAGFSSVHKMLGCPLIVYAIGQKAGPDYHKVLLEARASGAQLCMLYHQALTAQDSYWDNRRAVLDGLARYRNAAQAAPQPATAPILLEWPYLHEDTETPSPGINVVRNHPAEADYGHVIEQWCRLLAHLFATPRIPVAWTLDPAKATFKMPEPNYYPIGQYVGPNGLKQAHFDGVLKGCDGIYWMWLVSQSGLPLDAALQLPAVRAAQERVIHPIAPPRVNRFPQVRRNPKRPGR